MKKFINKLNPFTSKLQKILSSISESDILDLEHNAIKIQGSPVDIPQTDDDAKILTYDQENNRFILTIKGIYYSDYVEDESQSSTTDEITWTPKLRLTYIPLLSGNYIISWQAEIANSNANKGVECRLEQDDTIELAYSLNAPIVAFGWATCGGFKRIFLDTNSHTFDVDFKLENTGTAYIRRVRIEIRKAKDL